MSETTQPEGQDPSATPAGDEEKPSPMQTLLDNPFLLLFIGVTIPAVFYTIWGVMEIAEIPIAH